MHDAWRMTHDAHRLTNNACRLRMTHNEHRPMHDATGDAARYELGTLAGLLDRPCTRLTISCEGIVILPDYPS